MEKETKGFWETIAFNRRNFIKLLVGGAVGTAVSPLPWKLTDDIAIWTQNWPWVPVPAAGKFSYANTVCTLCPGGCGIKVRKADNRPIKIEGRTDYPVNPGGICPLGAGGLQVLYNENIRFPGPMKRVGPRGSGKFMDISWNEALKELAKRIAALRRQGRPDAIVAVDGNPAGTTTSSLVQRFLKAVGSPNYERIPTADDTYSMANWLTTGNKGPMAYDLENADFVLSFGCGLIEGWGAPGRVLNAWGLWHSSPSAGKVKIVQVEPRASNTASKADEWIAPLPGTETALALGLAHVIIREGLYHQGFVKDHAFGFMDWKSRDGKEHRGFKRLVLDQYSPEKVAQITGLKPSKIVSLARAFGRSRAPVALCGRGKGDLNGSLYEFMAVQCLNALKGNINQPGGVILSKPLPLSTWPEIQADSITQKGLEKPRLDRAQSLQFPFTVSLINNLSEVILEKGKSPVDTLLIFSANPAFTLPDGGSFREAMERIPYIVSFSPFKDDSALMADLILPDHTYLEKTEDIVWPRGLQYPLYGLSRPVTSPLYNTRHNGDTLITLAKLVGGSPAASFPWRNYGQALRARVRGLFESGGGLTTYDQSAPVWKGFPSRRNTGTDYTSFEDMWRKLKSGGLWYYPAHDFGNWDTVFETPSGAFEFASSRIYEALNELSSRTSPGAALKEMGTRAKGDEVFMPHFERVSVPEPEREYPLIMVPYTMINHSNTWAPNPPYLNKTLFDNQLRKDESFVEVNPQTASRYGLKQGDRIFIESPKGRIGVRVNLFEGAMPGVLFLPLGFGHRAYDAYERNKGANPNNIVNAGKDPISGHPVWWQTRVKILKA